MTNQGGLLLTTILLSTLPMLSGTCFTADATAAVSKAEGQTDIKGKEGNWLQTIPGKSWWLALRMYGPGEAWIKQTWRPGEIELVK